MTHKRKILFVAAFIALVITPILFFALSKQPEVRITYAGRSTNGSDRVSFNLTNPFPQALYCVWHFETKTNEADIALRSFVSSSAFNLDGYSETNFDGAISTEGSWRVVVECQLFGSSSRINELRWRLARDTANRNWYKLAGWLAPVKKLPTVYGPLMLGNKPAPEASK